MTKRSTSASSPLKIMPPDLSSGWLNTTRLTTGLATGRTNWKKLLSSTPSRSWCTSRTSGWRSGVRKRLQLRENSRGSASRTTSLGRYWQYHRSDYAETSTSIRQTWTIPSTSQLHGNKLSTDQYRTAIYFQDNRKTQPTSPHLSVNEHFKSIPESVMTCTRDGGQRTVGSLHNQSTSLLKVRIMGLVD